MPKHNAMVETFHAFAEATSAETASLDKKVLITARDWYDLTIGAALEEQPGAWTKAASEYVLKHVRRIGRIAGIEAGVVTGGPITKEILDQAVKTVIGEQQKVCLRAERTKSVDGRLRLLGIFCKRVPI